MKKILSIFMASILCVSSVFAAETTTTTDTTTKKPKQEFDSTKMVTGKITSITSSQVVINVATMKEMEKKEKSSQTSTTTTDTTTSTEKPSAEDMFTLTGTTKTIDISSATFGGSGLGQPPKMENNSSDNTNSQSERPEPPQMSGDSSMGQPQGQPQGEANGNPPEKPANDNNSSSSTGTYSDFAVGDYVMIELTESNGTVAKSMRSATMGGPQGGPKDGQNGNSNGKPKDKPSQKSSTDTTTTTE